MLSHLILAETVATTAKGCTSRALPFKNYVVGSGEANNAFVHICIKMLPGRTPEMLNDLGTQLLQLINETFKQSIEELNLSITIEIRHLGTYFK